jgi:hypothetical protein
MLGSFFRVRDLPLQGDLLQEERLVFVYAPDAQAGRIVDILLKKQGHDSGSEMRISAFNSNLDRKDKI